jgi:type II secretory pathway pseudopilin PulG
LACFADNAGVRVNSTGLLRAHRRALTSASDTGLSLIEAVAALAVAAIILTGLAYATVGGVKASTAARVNQQAGDILESTIEKARTAGYDAVVMYASDPDLTVSKDSRLVASGCPSGGSLCVSLPNPKGAGTVKENIVTSPAPGFLPNHVTTAKDASTNEVPFTVATYVTSPNDGTDATYKRVTVFVSWTQYGTSHVREGSTYVTETTRGLQLPHYTLNPLSGYPQIQTKNPGQEVMFGFRVENDGARDSWDITATDNTLAWAYYADTDGDGQYTDGVDVALTDNDGDGVRDTGLIDTKGHLDFWMIGTVPNSAANGSTYKANVQSTSVSQPTASTAIALQPVEVQVSTLITAPPTTPTATATPTPTSSETESPSPIPSPTETANSACTAVIDAAPAATGIRYYLHTTAPRVDQVEPISTAVTSFSLASAGNPGFRKQDDYNTNSSKGPAFEWRLQWQEGGNPTLHAGTAYVSVWAKPVGNPSSTVSLRAMIGYNSTGNTNNWKNLTSGDGHGDVSHAGCGDWQEYVVPVPITDQSLANNSWLQVLLFNTGSSDLLIAYDSAPSAYGFTGSGYVPGSVTFSGGIS